jgi:hypothetical protein
MGTLPTSRKLDTSAAAVPASRPVTIRLAIDDWELIETVLRDNPYTTRNGLLCRLIHHGLRAAIALESRKQARRPKHVRD